MQSKIKILYPSEIILSLIIILILHIISRYNYLLFHSLVEISIVVVAVVLFMNTWFSRNTLKNNYLLFLGLAYVFIAFIEVLHTLAYKGMGVFPFQNIDLSAKLWLVARYVEASALLIAPFMIKKQVKVSYVLAVYTIITAILLLNIYMDIFPTCFIEGTGLTPFKIYSEYLISFMMLGSLGMLWRQRDQFESYILNTLIVSIIFAVLAELAFTFYSNMYDLYTLLGHILKLFSFYLIYKAIVVTGFTRPFDLLSKDLILKERMLTEEKERFKELFKNTSVGNIIIKVTDDGKKFLLEDMNLASEAFIDFHRDEILGKDLNDIYNDEFESKIMKAIHQVWLTGKSMKIPEFYYHNNSIESWWELFIHRLSSGEIVIVSKDITLNKKLEKSQEELNEMLKVINKIMRHDISSDLSIISMSLEAFEENNDKKYLEYSQKSVKRCFKRISKMRNLEQMVSNRYELNPYNLQDLITEVSGNHRIKIDMKGNCVVMADEGLYSVIDNIVRNAVDHGQASHIDITVSEEDDICRMRIADNGIGILPDIKGNIFNEGFVYGSKGNTGLGLYISKKVMDRYGSISVEDNVPSGAVFVLTFKKYHESLLSAEKEIQNSE